MPARGRRRSVAAKASVHEPTKLGALRRYTISGLFGHRKIDFSLEEDEPTLLTGVNGTGKSTVLRTVDAVSTSEWHSLFSIPFTELRLEFENGVEFLAQQSDRACEVSLSDDVSWTAPREFFPGVRDFRFLQSDMLRSRHDSTMLATYRRFVQMQNDRTWGGDPALFNDIYHNVLSSADIAPPPEWLKAFPQRFPVFFITDQRLVIETATAPDKPRTEAVSTKVAAEEAAKNIAREIAIAQARYARTSQSLDRDFPRRVLQAMAEPTSISNDDLRDELEELAQQREQLQKAGLLPSSETDDFAYLDFTAPSASAVILTYVHDTRDKLAVLEPLRRRLALFTDFLNQHYQSAKNIGVDQQEGFVITVEGQDGPLPPARLSSGEQQILVLAHHILFRAAENTLVLIDEPELSLHVVWQSTLVEDLSQMGRERDLSFLLATHSPTLIAGREDLKRSLDK